MHQTSIPAPLAELPVIDYKAQTVTLELKPDAGYELLEGENKRQVSLKAEEVTSVKFKVKAKKVGSTDAASR